jgi:hypothetical protein
MAVQAHRQRVVSLTNRPRSGDRMGIFRNTPRFGGGKSAEVVTRPRVNGAIELPFTAILAEPLSVS